MRLWLLLSAALVLAACSSQPTHQPNDPQAQAVYQQSRDAVSGLPGWDLSGRLSLDDGLEGGSGRLDWKLRGPGSELKFSGALGRGAWQLNVGPPGAVLQRADGSSARYASLQALLQAEAGWQIPVDALQWWVMGQAAPGPVEQLLLDERGTLELLQQQGWQVRFDRYRAFGSLLLPGRLHATHGDYRVKLALVTWRAWDAAAGEE